MHAKADDTVKITYAYIPIVFYLQLRVDAASLMDEFASHESFPEWILPQRPWLPEAFYRSRYFRRIESAYERIELPYTDLLWDNRPDLGEHQFRDPTAPPHLVLYHRRGA